MTTEPKAIQLLHNLLANPYPSDLLALRRDIQRGGLTQEEAFEQLGKYCSAELLEHELARHREAKRAAQEFLERNQ